MNTIPAGTRIYLTKEPAHLLRIRPDHVLLNDIFCVAYDVRINGCTIIPKGTKVAGDWVTESSPIIAAQLQVCKIFLCGGIGQDFLADSVPYQFVGLHNAAEVDGASYVYELMNYVSSANLTRRIVRTQCRTRILMDNALDTVYIEVPTKEIPVMLLVDFVPGVPGTL